MATDTPSIPCVAILDDYQGVALSSADWTPLKGRVVIDVFRETILDEDGLVRRLEAWSNNICNARAHKVPTFFNWPVETSVSFSSSFSYLHSFDSPTVRYT
jgi:hypothetical protein